MKYAKGQRVLRKVSGIGEANFHMVTLRDAGGIHLLSLNGRSQKVFALIIFGYFLLDFVGCEGRAVNWYNIQRTSKGHSTSLLGRGLAAAQT